jgi:hypothetical protein
VWGGGGRRDNNNDNNSDDFGDNNNSNNQKIQRCKDLQIEVQCMWNVKAKVIPIIIGATGTLSCSF